MPAMYPWIEVQSASMSSSSRSIHKARVQARVCKINSPPAPAAEPFFVQESQYRSPSWQHQGTALQASASLHIRNPAPRLTPNAGSARRFHRSPHLTASRGTDRVQALKQRSCVTPSPDPCPLGLSLRRTVSGTSGDAIMQSSPAQLTTGVPSRQENRCQVLVACASGAFVACVTLSSSSRIGA
ncbi:hypothetical protein BJ546DRAFT_407793 [Cryomyces antarcticus]